MDNSSRYFPLSIALYALSIVLASPVRAQVTVEAPAPESARALAAWYNLHVPLRFRAAAPLLVRELTEQDMDAYLLNGSSDASRSDNNETGDIDGVFESSPDRLALRVPEGGAVEMLTFAHEYGHYVWFHLLTGDDRRRYGAIYNRQRDAGHLVTRYAQTDLEEGFAEAFSFYVSEAPILRHRDPVSYQFFAQRASAARHGASE